MISYIKKYPTEIMGIYFSLIFLMLAYVSTITPSVNQFVTIPMPIALTVFIALLIGLISIYLISIGQSVKSWRKFAELFIMLAAMCASLSDGFWIFSTVAAIIIILGNIQEKTLNLRQPIFYLWALMIGVAFISSFFATESKQLSFGASFGLLLYGLFFVAVYHQNFLQERGEEFLQRIGVLLSFSIVSTVIFSLWHFFFQENTLNVLIFSFQPKTGYGNSFGMASIYGEWPTHSSAFLSLSFWALLGIRLYPNLLRSRKLILNMGILFALIGSLATLSRNAFLFMVLSIGIALLILLIKERSKKMLFLCGGVGVFFIGVLAFFVTHFEKWRNLFMNPLQQNTIADRIDQYKFALTQLQLIDNPFLGIGLMNFGPFYRRIQQNENLTDYLHQLFLSITLEIGYIGIMVFVILFVTIGVSIVKYYRCNSKNIIFVIIFFAWSVTGIFDNWLYFMWSSTLFMILIALGSYPKMEKNNE